MTSTVLRTDQLTSDEKHWFAVAICGAIIADGNVAPEELKYLEKALSFLPSTEKVDGLIQGVKDQKLPALGPLSNSSRETQTKMLFEIISVIASDNALSTREMEYLFRIGQKLGFPAEYVQMVMRWGNEGIVWRRKMGHLLQVGVELEPEYGE